jgi:hypothetical protein
MEFFINLGHKLKSHQRILVVLALVGLIILASLVCISLVTPNSHGACGGSMEQSILCEGDMAFHKTVVSFAIPVFSFLIAIIFIALLSSGNLYRYLFEIASLKTFRTSKAPHKKETWGPFLLTRLFSKGLLNPQIYG